MRKRNRLALFGVFTLHIIIYRTMHMFICWKERSSTVTYIYIYERERAEVIERENNELVRQDNALYFVFLRIYLQALQTILIRFRL
jgi:hypothetical protein